MRLPGRRSARPVAYAVAVLSALAVLACLGLLDGWLQGHYSFLPLVATMLVALAFGTRPALVMVALVTLGLSVGFLAPRNSLSIPPSPSEIFYLATFLAGTSLVALVAGAQRRARLQAQAAMAALQSSQDRLRVATEFADVGLADFDLAAGRQHISPIAQRHFGIGPGEGLSLDLLPPELLPGAAERSQRARKEAHPPRHTAEFRVAGNAHQLERWLAAWATELRDAQGRTARLVVLTFDITQRKRAEREVRASEERFRWLSEALPQLVWIFDAQGAVGYANRRCLEYFGGPPRELPDWRSVHPEDVALTAERFQGASRAGIEYSVEHRHRRTDGAYHWFLCRAFPMLDAAGRIAQWVATSTDIHGTKLTEQSLRSSQERLKLATDAAGLAVFTLEASSGRITWESECRHVRAQGGREDRPTSIEEFLRRFVHPDDVDAYRRAYAGAMSPGRAFHCTVRTHGMDQPEWRHVEFSGRFELGYDGSPQRLVAVCRDVTDRVRMEEALREAGRRKDEFLGVLSHELRNPLAPIRNSVYLLNRCPLGERARKAAEVIERQVSQLTNLVDDLLDVTRITRGKIRLRTERLDFAVLVRHALDDLRSERGASAVELRQEIPDEPLWVDGDPARLAQIVGNLVNNALKFTPQGGTVRVVVGRDGPEPRVNLVVSDTGVGMDAETLSRLFQPFAQADRSLDRTRGGLGLGLALVKGLVHLHGGEIHASSEGPGRGSTFAVHLPLASSERPQARAGQPRRVAFSPRRRVLIVEDNRDMAESLRDILGMSGHLVEVAYNGRRGLEKARQLKPHVVLCDIGLPDLDGYAVARQLRRDASLSSALLVALTGYALPEDRRRALEAGFDRHLSKPPDPEAIAMLLDEAPAPGPTGEETAPLH